MATCTFIFCQTLEGPLLGHTLGQGEGLIRMPGVLIQKMGKLSPNSPTKFQTCRTLGLGVTAILRIEPYLPNGTSSGATLTLAKTLFIPAVRVCHKGTGIQIYKTQLNPNGPFFKSQKAFYKGWVRVRVRVRVRAILIGPNRARLGSEMAPEAFKWPRPLISGAIVAPAPRFGGIFWGPLSLLGLGPLIFWGPLSLLVLGPQNVEGPLWSQPLGSLIYGPLPRGNLGFLRAPIRSRPIITSKVGPGL